MGARRSSLEVARDRAELAELRLKATVLTKRREEFERAYEAATPTNYHPRRKETRSADAVMNHANGKLRNIARYLDENHDLAIGVLDDLVNKLIGTGIAIEPLVKRVDRTLHANINRAIRRLYLKWTSARPDSTREHPWGETQRLACRSWLRDGEILVHHIEGEGQIQHSGPVPYSIELLEADFLPFQMFRAGDSQNVIVHGVEKNGWRQPVAYHFYLDHPGDTHTGLLTRLSLDTKRVSADEVTHIKFVRRLGQTRGITIFHGVLSRLEDLKEYDDSERIAARVASAFTAVITRAADYQGPAIDTVAGASRRVLEMAPGMIFDNLLPGEGVETIGNDRPNAQYANYIDQNIRRVVGGTGNAYSSVAKKYDGNYAAQRQELVESEVLYGKAREYFVTMFHREIYRRFIDMAVASGSLSLIGIDRESLYDAEFVPPATSWIDPLKEVKAYREAVEAGFVSRKQVVRKLGNDPATVDEQNESDDFVPKQQSPTVAAPTGSDAEEDDESKEAA